MSSFYERLRGFAIILISLLGMAVFYHYINPIYPIGNCLAWPILTIWAWVLFAQYSWLSLGYFLLVRILQIRERPALETMVLSMTVGMVGFTESMHLAGALGLYGAYFSVGLRVTFIVLGSRSLHPFISSLLHEFQIGQTWSFYPDDSVDPRRLSNRHCLFGGHDP